MLGPRGHRGIQLPSGKAGAAKCRESCNQPRGGDVLRRYERGGKEASAAAVGKRGVSVSIPCRAILPVRAGCSGIVPDIAVALGFKHCGAKGRLVWRAREMIGRNCRPAHLANLRGCVIRFVGLHCSDRYGHAVGLLFCRDRFVFLTPRHGKLSSGRATHSPSIFRASRSGLAMHDNFSRGKNSDAR